MNKCTRKDLMAHLLNNNNVFILKIRSIYTQIQFNIAKLNDSIRHVEHFNIIQ
jgi:hypothetical protein